MDHRFIWYLCKMQNIMPDDEKITEMDPIQKLWMFEHWLEDQVEQAELAKNHAFLLASFSHPEAVRQALGHNTIKSTDEELDETSKMVRDFNLKKMEEGTKKKRKRKKLIKDNNATG